MTADGVADRDRHAVVNELEVKRLHRHFVADLPQLRRQEIDRRALARLAVEARPDLARQRAQNPQRVLRVVRLRRNDRAPADPPRPLLLLRFAPRLRRLGRVTACLACPACMARLACPLELIPGPRRPLRLVLLRRRALRCNLRFTLRRSRRRLADITAAACDPDGSEEYEEPGEEKELGGEHRC